MNLLLPPDVVATIASKIAPLDTPDVRNAYETGNFPRSEMVKDLDKRYRWDLLNAACGPSFVCDLYADYDCTDKHIDSALRSIVRPLNGKAA